MRRPLTDLPDSRKAVVIKNRIAAQKSYLKRKSCVVSKEPDRVLVIDAAESQSTMPAAREVAIPSFNSLD